MREKISKQKLPDLIAMTGLHPQCEFVQIGGTNLAFKTFLNTLIDLDLQPDERARIELTLPSQLDQVFGKKLLKGRELRPFGKLVIVVKREDEGDIWEIASKAGVEVILTLGYKSMPCLIEALKRRVTRGGDFSIGPDNDDLVVPRNGESIREWYHRNCIFVLHEGIKEC